MSKILIEGIDRLGKNTLIDGIINKLGYHDVIHYSKPIKLDAYEDLKSYQVASFKNLFRILNTPYLNLIANRTHLGENIYADLYRGYSGSYVFELERAYNLDIPAYNDLTLILLTQDINRSTHFVDDGESLGPIEAREKEQDLFIKAFNKSIIQNKHIVCVTDTKTGNFRTREEILEEVLSYTL